MDVILLSDVEKVGLRGEVVSVARGYARNFLLPRRLAETATAAKVAELRRVEAARALHEARSSEQAAEIADVLGKTVLRFEVKAGPTGSLFGSVTPSEIADEIWRTRKIRVDRRKIAIDPIKRIGRYAIPINVFEDVNVEVKTLLFQERVIALNLPLTVDLLVRDTAPAIKGATAQAQVKPATVETGIQVLVPSYIESGEKIRVDTRDGRFVERAK